MFHALNKIAVLIGLSAGLIFWLAPQSARGADSDAPLATTSREASPLIMTALPWDDSSIRIPAPQQFNARRAPTSAFSINYLAAGTPDGQGATCLDWDPAAQAAFTYAASIWATMLPSTVPIKIDACWANLGSTTTLGYSWSNLSRDFAGAPYSGTWYTDALADSIAGVDLDPTQPDIYITYNDGFAWYYGTDGLTPTSQYDFVSVVMHEIGHGLDIAGTMAYGTPTCSRLTRGCWGFGTGYPAIYDRFIQNGSGQALLSFSNNSATLGSQLIGNNLYFNGANARAANSGNYVKIYAPITWSSGSSYSHLDYTTFRNTPNRLMVYAISSASSIHDPGSVVLAMLKDMGWHKLNQTMTITAHAPTTAIMDSSFGVSATTSSGLPVSFSSSGGCVNTDNVFTMTSGTVTCTVLYDQPGSADYNPVAQQSDNVSAQKAESITQIVSSVSVSELGQAITLTATVVPSTTTGTIQFYADGATMDTPQTLLNGQSILAVSALAARTHTITATYSGDPNYIASVSSAISQTVNCASAITVINSNNSQFGSLRQAIADLCGGGVITFDPIVFGVPQTITLASEIVITKNLSIDGSSVAFVPILSGNSATRVLSITAASDVTLNRLEISHGYSAADGGGIYNQGTLTVTRSTLVNNNALNGGGIFNLGTMQLINSTLANNHATNASAILNVGNLTILNSTLANNQTSGANGAVIHAGINTTIRNTIIAQNQNGNCVGAFDPTSQNNFSDDGTCGASFVNSSHLLLSALVTNSSGALLVPLLPNSVAIDAGDPQTCVPFDQRGLARISGCDVGAYESQGFILGLSGGDQQSTVIHSYFADSVAVSVTSLINEPVDGGQVIFTAAEYGASVITPTQAITILNGVATATQFANNLAGTFSITAATRSTTPILFALTNDKATPTLAIHSSLNPAPFDVPVTFTSNLTFTADQPTGAVQFYANGAALGKPQTLTQTQAALTTMFPIGTHIITATYSGDANYNATQGALMPDQQIVRAIVPITCTNLNQIYDGTPKSINAATTPLTLTISITYTGVNGTLYPSSQTAPTNAGAYQVDAIVDDANYQGTATATLVITKAMDAIPLDNLMQTYDSTSKPITATTTHLGLIVLVTYTGTSGTFYPASPIAPTNAGNYRVDATIDDANYQGTATATLVIAKAMDAITLGNLIQTYDGASKPITHTTTHLGLTVLVTYTGTSGTLYPASQTAPTNAGTYQVGAMIDDANYQGTATATLVIAQANALIQLGNLNQIFDGWTRPITATTSPPGLGMLITYTSINYPASQIAPITAGDYSITATINDPNYQGATTAQLNIAQINSTTTLLTSLNPSILGQAVSFTTLVTSTTPITPTGSVTLAIDSRAPISQSLINGSISFSINDLGIGSHIITATFSGDTNYWASLASGAQQIEYGVPTLSALNPLLVPINAPAFDLMLTGSNFANGASVILWNGIERPTRFISSTQLATTVETNELGALGVVTVTIVNPTPGGGQATPALDLMIGQGNLQIDLTAQNSSSVWQKPITFTVYFTQTFPARLPGSITPSGILTFTDNTTSNLICGNVIVNNWQMLCATAALTVGTHSLIAIYSGDGNYAASQSANLLINVGQATITPTLISSLNPAILGQSITFSVTIGTSVAQPSRSLARPTSCLFGGTIQLKDGVNNLGSAQSLNANCAAAWTTNALGAGGHSITASYSGDANYLANASNLIRQLVLTRIFLPLVRR